MNVENKLRNTCQKSEEQKSGRRHNAETYIRYDVHNMANLSYLYWYIFDCKHCSYPYSETSIRYNKLSLYQSI